MEKKYDLEERLIILKVIVLMFRKITETLAIKFKTAQKNKK